jgi:oligopeptide/dipeptide ABC transporter ATP-binding protein
VCEIGPLEAVVSDPKHPYTRALLSALPRADVPRGTRLEAIPGEPPDPSDPPLGCPFAPRCPHVMDICGSVNPPHFDVGPERTAACHLWAPERAEAVAR